MIHISVKPGTQQHECLRQPRSCSRLQAAFCNHFTHSGWQCLPTSPTTEGLNGVSQISKMSHVTFKCKAHVFYINYCGYEGHFPCCSIWNDNNLESVSGGQISPFKLSVSLYHSRPCVGIYVYADKPALASRDLLFECYQMLNIASSTKGSNNNMTNGFYL